MDLYLPIAGLPINVFLLLAMGAAVGFISGLFGVGGGFLLTPLLIFTGIPTAVSVATVSSQIVASSASGAFAYLRKQQLDLKLGTALLISGIIGSIIGVEVFSLLRRLGQLDLMISVAYVLLLGTIGGLMVIEAVGTKIRLARGFVRPPRQIKPNTFIAKLPLKMTFERSKLTISLIPVVLLGICIGFLGALLGIGGGFIMVPALIYLLRVPTNIVIGTTLFQTFGTLVVSVIMHAATNHSVDVVLGLALMVGGVIGAQFGARVGQTLRGETLRLLLGLLVLAVGLRFLIELVATPTELYSISRLGGALL